VDRSGIGGGIAGDKKVRFLFKACSKQRKKLCFDEYLSEKFRKRLWNYEFFARAAEAAAVAVYAPAQAHEADHDLIVIHFYANPFCFGIECFAVEYFC
jgi:hypothetical protein